MATKVSLGFARLSDDELNGFAQSVIDSMDGNAAFPTPPVTVAVVRAQQEDFSDKLSAARVGGPAATADKNRSRQVLEGSLRQWAGYVQIVCANDNSMLLSSGFQAQGFSNTPSPLSQPQGLRLKNGNAGQLIARIDPIDNANTYEGRARLSDGDWLPSVFTGDSQHIRFEGLAHGKDYTVQVRALGGSTGQSDWSDPSTHMAM